jgi:hypothetical protein
MVFAVLAVMGLMFATFASPAMARNFDGLNGQCDNGLDGLDGGCNGRCDNGLDGLDNGLGTLDGLVGGCNDLNGLDSSLFGLGGL